MNIDKDYLKRLNYIIEKTKGYENVAFPIGTNGEFGALYISDLKQVLSEFKQLIEVSIDTVFERNNFETEALAHTLHKLGIIDKRGNLYVYHKKLEKEVLKDE